MGRYRRGHKHQKWRDSRDQKQRENGGDGDSKIQMTDSDWMLLEGYLLEYRSKACEAYCSKGGKSIRNHDVEPMGDDPVIIGKHQFLPLTTASCRRPYIYLPDTLNDQERRNVHKICAFLDLYHVGVASKVGAVSSNDPTEDNGGKNSSDPTFNRRIAVSIFVNGLEFVPDCGLNDSQSFPSRTCRPWFHRAYGNSTKSDRCNENENDNDPFKERKHSIEMEKRQIRHFTKLPEQSVRGLDGGCQSCDSLDFSVLDALDLAMVPTPADTPWMLVDTIEKLILCADELVYGADSSDKISQRSSKIHELAFDLEMHNISEGKSGIRTCLIQLTSDVYTTIVDDQGVHTKRVYKDFIVDPLAPGVWDAIPTHLGPIFSDPHIVKIGHGIGGMDISSLHRDFGILIVNAFDTYEASTVLSQSRKGMSLLSLCRHYGLPDWEHYKMLKENYQKSDWRKRPLDSSALEYGRFDIRYLVTLRKLLHRDLTKIDMLGVPVRIGSSLEEDSGVELASSHISNDEASVNSLDLRMDSRITDATSSFSENEFVNSSGSPSSPIPIIHASEFPCYHHLMKAISLSQKRCLMLWSDDDVEPITRNPSLLSMIKQATKQRGYGKYWSDVHMQLYKKLVEWRLDTARREFNTVDVICSLDFLIFVAYKLPTSRSAMRRYSYVLPATLQDDTVPYYNELCELVRSSDAFKRHQHPPLSDVNSIDVLYYSDKFENEKIHDRRTIFPVLIVSAVCGAFVIAMTRARRK
ncbi:hypothetical protein ACHAXA_007547 [Cyclostephanos tholiformis]|uniref:HRDC domain-containing protein n=1 Tax=Cyclostephanos tholiformis TaxID=382380 RepID=A0ABD3SRI8_9STRA